MYHKIDIKKEIIDDFNDSNNNETSDKSLISNKFQSYYPFNDYKKDEKSEPPKKVMKTRVDKLLESMSCEKLDELKKTDKKYVKNEESKTVIDKRYDLYIDLNLNNNINPNKTFQMTNISFDIFLQELFSWNPEWLQGRAITKPPLKKFEKQMISNPFKVDYNREEYISRHLPFIESELFIKLSDSFKNDAPSRCKHDIFINDCEDSSNLDINRKLICYSLRDLHNNSKPICKVSDISILQLKVVSIGDKRCSQKQYFGVIVGHSMLESSELEPEILKQFLCQTNNHEFLLWDKYTIVTKRSRETTIFDKQMARIEVILNACFELRQAENLLYNNWKCTKLLSNIFNAIGNIHQFSQSELADNESVKKTLTQNAIDMINKANPMVYFKGVNNIMVVDISDEKRRLQYLCDIITETIESFHKNNGKVKLLVIAKNDDVSLWWRETLKRVSIQSHVRPWSVDNGRGWTRHEDVRRYTKHNAMRIQNSCVGKLNNLSGSSSSYEELSKRKDSYQKVIDSCNKFSHKGSSLLTTSALIAKEELLLKGYEQLLKDCNVIIGTFQNLINCQLLFKETAHKKLLFDCCIIDDSQSLPDTNMLSIIHSGVKSIIIAGDSDGFAFCSNPNAAEQKFNISLFNRIFMKCLNLS